MEESIRESWNSTFVCSLKVSHFILLLPNALFSLSFLLFVLYSHTQVLEFYSCLILFPTIAKHFRLKSSRSLSCSELPHKSLSMIKAIDLNLFSASLKFQISLIHESSLSWFSLFKYLVVKLFRRLLVFVLKLKAAYFFDDFSDKFEFISLSYCSQQGNFFRPHDLIQAPS